jgi:hypothetical protein
MMTTLRIFAVSALALGMMACSSSSSPSSNKTDSGTKKDGASHVDGEAKKDGEATKDGEAKKDGEATKDGAKGYDAPSPTTVAAFCPDWLAAQAAHLGACKGGPAAAWLVNLEAGGTCTQIAAAVTAGRVKFDATQTHACLEAYASFTCAEGDDQAEPTACKSALAGTVKSGATCYADIDCAGSSYCAGFDQATCSGGKCEALVAAGDTCKLGDECVAGYTCYKDGGDGGALKCNKTPVATGGAAKGATCGYDKTTKKTVTCAQGLQCDALTLVCVPTVKLGGACTDGASECDLYEACDPTTKKCTQFPVAGGDCGYSSGQDDIGCLGQTYCKVSASDPTAGTCADQLGSGASCVTDVQCITGKCEKASKDAGTGTCTKPCTEM